MSVQYSVLHVAESPSLFCRYLVSVEVKIKSSHFFATFPQTEMDLCFLDAGEKRRTDFCCLFVYRMGTSGKRPSLKGDT